MNTSPERMGKIRYRCRLCGTTFVISSERACTEVQFAGEHGKSRRDPAAFFDAWHKCEDGGAGLAEVVGWRPSGPSVEGS